MGNSLMGIGSSQTGHGFTSARLAAREGLVSLDIQFDSM